MKLALALPILLIAIACTIPVEPELTPGQKLAAAQKTADGYYDIDAETALYLIDNELNLVTLDVSNAYDGGHLPFAVNIPIGELSASAIDASRPYLVYGQLINNSMKGAKIVAGASSKPVYRLIGEYKYWAETGYELDTKKCHLTVGSEPVQYGHVHVWCEHEFETRKFCTDAGKCHTHRILEQSNFASETLPGPHSHTLRAG